MCETHDQDPDGEIPPPKHPERPSSEPSMSSAEGEWDDRVLKDGPEDGSVVALHDPRDRYRELPIVQLLQAHVDRILDTPAK